MGKVLFGIIVVVASMVLAESLICNKCSFALLGVCMNNANVTCTTNTSVCFTGRTSFPSLTDFVGFNNQGCQEPAGCNATTNGTVLGATYQTTIQCCSTDRCNPITLNGAPSTRMTLTAAVGAAFLATLWGSML